MAQRAELGPQRSRGRAVAIRCASHKHTLTHERVDDDSHAIGETAVSRHRQKPEGPLVLVARRSMDGSAVAAAALRNASERSLTTLFDLVEYASRLPALP